MSLLTDVCKYIFRNEFYNKTGKEYFGGFYNLETKEYQNRYTNKCFSLYIKFDDSIATLAKFYCPDYKNIMYIRDYKKTKITTIPSVIVNITKNDFMKIILENNILTTEIDDIILNGLNIDKFKEPDIFDEGYDECDLLHILLAFHYKDEDIEKVCDYAREDHQKLFPKIEGAVYHRNRLYIPVNGNYLVLSKNPYDFVWASTGNNYCSCFNLDSPTHYIQASPFMCTLPWFFMCYYTNGSTVKFSAFKEKKFKIPQIYGRFWCYKENNTMYSDTIYCENNKYDIMVLLQNKFFETDDTVLIDTKQLDIHYNTYLDSLITNLGIVKYKYRSSRAAYKVNSYDMSFKEIMNRIKYNPELTVDMLPVSILDGMYKKSKKCPKTGLMIDYNSEEHWLAKYIDKVCKHTLLFTYSIEDNVLINDEEDVLKNCDDLESAKENIRYYIKQYSDVDCIVLRMIKGNKVTFQPFYRKD